MENFVDFIKGQWFIPNWDLIKKIWVSSAENVILNSASHTVIQAFCQKQNTKLLKAQLDDNI